MRFPFKRYKLGTRFGAKGKLWQCGHHSGLDLVSAAYGGDGLVHPLYGGVVYKISSGGSYGNCVWIKHGDGYITLYAHLKLVYVRKNMEVDEDTVLGVEGMTGNASGRHLHIEVHKGSYNYPAVIDPLEFINKRLEENEVQKNIKINLNGAIKTVCVIEKDGNNYIRLQDLRDEKIVIGYDDKEKLPIVAVRG